MDVYLLATCLFVGLACFFLTPPVAARLARLVARFERSVEETLAELFMFHVTPRSVTLMVAGFMTLCVVVMYMAFPGPVSAFIGGAIGLALPLIIIYQMVKRRRSKLEIQLLDGLITLANGMRAGLNLGQAIGLIENHNQPPISQEFGLINREVEHGTSIDRALDNASVRLRSHNYRLLFAAMKTTRLRGGNMPDTLDRLGESLREIVRLEEKVKAQSAEGRMSAIFMSVMPVIVLGIYWLIDPGGVNLLLHDPIGQFILAGVILLSVAGFLWMRKVLSFDI